MAVAGTHLTTNGDANNATSYTTASISPTANRLVLATVLTAISGGNPTLPTLSGASMTWTQVGTVVSAGNVTRLTVFRALAASPGSGAITIDCGGVTQSRGAWTISEFAGVNTSGTNGANAVRNFTSNENSGSQTGITVTLPAFAQTGNGTFGVVAQEVNPAAAITEGSGFTELGEANWATEGRIQSEWKATNDTSVDWTWSSTNVVSLAIALELCAPDQANTLMAWG